MLNLLQRCVKWMQIDRYEYGVDVGTPPHPDSHWGQRNAMVDEYSHLTREKDHETHS